MATHIYIHRRRGRDCGCGGDAISIESVRRLYERPGTPGEKEAARQALIRMGADPSSLGERSTQGARPSAAARQSSGPKRYHVFLVHEADRFDVVVEASDEIAAEMKAREAWKRQRRDLKLYNMKVSSPTTRV